MVVSINMNDVSNRQLSSAPGFLLAVDQDFSLLNQQLCLSTRAGDAAQFQELIEADRIPFLLSCSQVTSPSHSIYLNDSLTRRQIVHETPTA